MSNQTSTPTVYVQNPPKSSNWVVIMLSVFLAAAVIAVVIVLVIYLLPAGSSSSNGSNTSGSSSGGFIDPNVRYTMQTTGGSATPLFINACNGCYGEPGDGTNPPMLNAPVTGTLSNVTFFQFVPVDVTNHEYQIQMIDIDNNVIGLLVVSNFVDGTPSIARNYIGTNETEGDTFIVQPISQTSGIVFSETVPSNGIAVTIEHKDTSLFVTQCSGTCGTGCFSDICSCADPDAACNCASECLSVQALQQRPLIAATESSTPEDIAVFTLYEN